MDDCGSLSVQLAIDTAPFRWLQRFIADHLNNSKEVQNLSVVMEIRTLMIVLAVVAISPSAGHPGLDESLLIANRRALHREDDVASHATSGPYPIRPTTSYSSSAREPQRYPGDTFQSDSYSQRSPVNSQLIHSPHRHEAREPGVHLFPESNYGSLFDMTWSIYKSYEERLGRIEAGKSMEGMSLTDNDAHGTREGEIMTYEKNGEERPKVAQGVLVKPDNEPHKNPVEIQLLRSKGPMRGTGNGPRLQELVTRNSPEDIASNGNDALNPQVGEQKGTVKKEIITYKRMGKKRFKMGRESSVITPETKPSRNPIDFHLLESKGPADVRLTYLIDPSKVANQKSGFNSNIFQIGLRGIPEKSFSTIYLRNLKRKLKKKLRKSRANRGSVKNQLRSLKASFLAEDSLRTIRRRYRNVKSLYRDRMTLKLETKLNTRDRTSFDKLLYTYIYLVDMITTIIPKPSYDDVGVAKAEAFKDALNRLAQYDLKEKDWHGGGPFRSRGSTMSSMWRYLSHWLSSDKYYTDLEIADTHGILNHWKTIFNLAFANSIDRLDAEMVGLFDAQRR
ncbi:hypothetical protein H4Q26_001670 [Puccinia striiformis f. sp. tritici PST-130]|nr:hypothetical protein H4Q26_001670 [Puccinia striiformis f. sp. tritici PST-130]KNE93520.1 hypothetical protein PSTG_13147 [Puccinia striiformis f. sp. tritici PST-78]